ncbi:hypothetical protein GCM10009544_36050 [Streptomyces stramineus]|uniref:Uncharacterized protein n=1 Tax=Streptomyces stramineus TaxID=173861 RepID=A0ABP3K6Y5_9ACTN
MTVAPLDLGAIRATVRRALERRAARPPRPEIEEINQALCHHLRLMLAHAQIRADRLHRGSVQWDHWQALIDRVRADLDRTGDEGMASDAAHMETLGRGARFLADCLDE